MFSNIGMLLMVLMMLGNHSMEKTSLQLGRCWRVRCKVGTRERGKCHLAVLHGSSSMIRNTICSGISLTWQLIKVQLRKQLMTWGNAELHKFILWECLTSRHLWCKNNDHQRGYVMCHVRQYIPIQNSINKDVGPLNWQNPIRWIFGRTSNHLLDSGWLHCSSCPEVTLATSMASNFGRQQGLWSIFRGNGWLIIEKNTWNIYLYWSRS